MTFFFNVWTSSGFVLASDVRLSENYNEQGETFGYMHKIFPSPHWRMPNGVKCAIAVAGVDPKVCKHIFSKACALGNNLREIAKFFAIHWTEHFAGEEKYSAVHLVGYESYPSLDKQVPQMWYWSTHGADNSFLSKAKLQENLAEFDDPSKPIPFNYHLPHKIRELTGKFPVQLPIDEYLLSQAFLQITEPFFTWNGDTDFWSSATDVVNSAIKLLRNQKPTWTIDETAELTGYCLEFLAKVSVLLPKSTVGLSSDGEFDIVTITAEKITAKRWSNLPVEP